VVLTKAKMIDLIYEELGISKKNALKFVKLVLDTVKVSLMQDQELKISGLGCFYIRKKKSRIGRNLKTGQVVQIHARWAVHFRASRVLKKQVNQDFEREFFLTV